MLFHLDKLKMYLGIQQFKHNGKSNKGCKSKYYEQKTIVIVQLNPNSASSFQEKHKLRNQEVNKWQHNIICDIETFL